MGDHGGQREMPTVGHGVGAGHEDRRWLGCRQGLESTGSTAAVVLKEMTWRGSWVSGGAEVMKW
jgi:hypothetical protein